MFRTNEILDDTWEVKRKVAKGTFCELLIAKDIRSQHLVAVKVVNDEIEGGVIKSESDVLKALDGQPFVPKFLYYGQHNGKDYIVMEYLDGEDMGKLRNRIRTVTPCIPLLPTVYLTLQMLSCIRMLHKRGFIHRDIKPSNFVRTSKKPTSFYVIDFGVAKYYLDKTGGVKPKRDSAEFRGTSQYASIHAHDAEDLCPRDDLWSLVYVFIDLLCGRLPWSELAKAREKSQVGALKREYLTSPQKWKTWISDCFSEAAVVAGGTSGKARGMVGPPKMPSENSVDKLLEAMTYLESLNYDHSPDYDYLERVWTEMAEEQADPALNITLLDAANPKFAYEGFDWAMEANVLKSDLEPVATIDQKLLVLAARARLLDREIRTLLLEARAKGEGSYVSEDVHSSGSVSLQDPEPSKANGNTHHEDILAVSKVDNDTLAAVPVKVGEGKLVSADTDENATGSLLASDHRATAGITVGKVVTAVLARRWRVLASELMTIVRVRDPVAAARHTWYKEESIREPVEVAVKALINALETAYFFWVCEDWGPAFTPSPLVDKTARNGNDSRSSKDKDSDHPFREFETLQEEMFEMLELQRHLENLPPEIISFASQRNRDEERKRKAMTAGSEGYVDSRDAKTPRR